MEYVTIADQFQYSIRLLLTLSFDIILPRKKSVLSGLIFRSIIWTTYLLMVDSRSYLVLIKGESSWNMYTSESQLFNRFCVEQLSYNLRWLSHKDIEAWLVDKLFVMGRNPTYFRWLIRDSILYWWVVMTSKRVYNLLCHSTNYYIFFHDRKSLVSIIIYSPQSLIIFVWNISSPSFIIILFIFRFILLIRNG